MYNSTKIKLKKQVTSHVGSIKTSAEYYYTPACTCGWVGKMWAFEENAWKDHKKHKQQMNFLSNV